MPTLTVVLNLQSLAFPTITNSIRVDVAPQDNPDNIVATETDNHIGHPARIWSFPGLPRTNYLVTMNEIGADGSPLNNLAYFDVVPDSLTMTTVREDEQLHAGVTPGFDVGQDEFYFDGRMVSDGGVVTSDLDAPYKGKPDPKSFAFTLSGTPNIGDKVQFDFSVDKIDVASPYFSLVSQSNPNANAYTAQFTGNVSKYNRLNVNGVFNSNINFNVTSGYGFTSTDSILQSVINQLNNAFPSSSVLVNKTGNDTPAPAGALVSIDYGGLRFRSGAISTFHVQNTGSGYVPGTYPNVKLLPTVPNGNESVFTSAAVIVNSDHTITTLTIKDNGYGWTKNQRFTVDTSSMGGVGIDFNCVIDSIYAIGDDFPFSSLSGSGSGAYGEITDNAGNFRVVSGRQGLGYTTTDWLQINVVTPAINPIYVTAVTPTGASAWYFTIKGIPKQNTKVQVDFTYDSGSGLQNYSVISYSMSGWSIGDTINDLLTQINNITFNAELYTDVDGESGVKINSTTTNHGTVTITNTVGINAARNDIVPNKGFIINATNVAGNSVVQLNSVGLPITNASVSTVLQAGQTLADMISSLLSQAKTQNPLATTYSDGTNNGIKTIGYSNSTGTITITKVQTPSGGGGLAPDYRGWNINPERRNMGGTMNRDFEYSWNPDTGYLKLLAPGDMLLPGEFWNIDFDPQESPAGGSDPDKPTVIDFSFTNKLITTNYTLIADDFGNNLIVEPSGTYLELTFPAANTTKEGLPVKISVLKSGFCCVKLKGTIKSNFGQSIYLIGGESIEVYCFVRTTGNNEYRYLNASGNFSKVGQIVNYDQVNSAMYTTIKLDGGLADINTHARLWQYVQSLPAIQRVSFATWNSNPTLFSDVSGSSFHVPDRSSLYARPTKSGDTAGNRVNAQILNHKHIFPLGSGSSFAPPYGRTSVYGKVGWKDMDNDNDYWFTNDGNEMAGAGQLNPAGLFGTENRPNSYLTNLYVLL